MNSPNNVKLAIDHYKLVFWTSCVPEVAIMGVFGPVVLGYQLILPWPFSQNTTQPFLVASL